MFKKITASNVSLVKLNSFVSHTNFHQHDKAQCSMIFVILTSFFNGDFEFVWLAQDIASFKKILFNFGLVHCFKTFGWYIPNFYATHLPLNWDIVACLSCHYIGLARGTGRHVQYLNSGAK